jgi:hypothetical protein
LAHFTKAFIFNGTQKFGNVSGCTWREMNWAFGLKKDGRVWLHYELLFRLWKLQDNHRFSLSVVASTLVVLVSPVNDLLLRSSWARCEDNKSRTGDYGNVHFFVK